MGLTSEEEFLALTYLNRLKTDFFSQKINETSYQFFNENQVIQNLYQKPLGMLLDSKLNFEEH